ncbi:MAG: ArsA family ATPase, partial [Acidobacteriales bacterium]|nr:ArsA family ATPase [Terriglobales bacterium]
MTRLSFFLGKGGVGKTTVSAAYAVDRAAEARGKVVLVSADPAHSLSDVFERPLGDGLHAIAVRGAKRLWVEQIGTPAGLRELFGRGFRELVDVIATGTFFEKADIEPLLESSMPGMAEVAALVRIEELLDSGEYEEVVVDSAPMGHSLRVFELPETVLRFLDFLEAAQQRDQVLAQRFGGSAGVRSVLVEHWQRKMERVRSALASE